MNILSIPIRLLGVAALLCLAVGSLVLWRYLTPTVAQAEQYWNENGVRHYHIQVTYEAGPRYKSRHDITVKDGQVLDDQIAIENCRMTNGGCSLAWGGDQTVPGLFGTARTAMQEYQPWVTVRFDWRYGFPRRIIRDNPQVFDDDVTWNVEAFDVLP